MRKWILLILLVIVATPIMGLIAWYGISFHPHVNAMKQMANSGVEMAIPVYAPLKYYGKTLKSMSERELAGLVAVVRSPSRFKPESSHSEERI